MLESVTIKQPGYLTLHFEALPLRAGMNTELMNLSG